MTVNLCDDTRGIEATFEAMTRELNLQALAPYLPNPGTFPVRQVESLCDAVKIEGTGPAYPCNAALVNLNLTSGYAEGEAPDNSNLRMYYQFGPKGRGYQPGNLVGYIAAVNYGIRNVPVVVYGNEQADRDVSELLDALGIPCFIGEDAMTRALWAVLLILLNIREGVCFYDGNRLAIQQGKMTLSAADMIKRQVFAIFNGPDEALKIVSRYLKETLHFTE